MKIHLRIEISTSMFPCASLFCSNHKLYFYMNNGILRKTRKWFQWLAERERKKSKIESPTLPRMRRIKSKQIENEEEESKTIIIYIINEFE